MPHFARRTISLTLVLASALLIWLGTSTFGSAKWVPDHIVIVIEENLSFEHLVPELEYLSELMRESATFTDAHGIDHPSQPNYLALFSGSTQGVGSEKMRNPDGSNPIIGGRTQVGSNEIIDRTPLTTPNLGAALIRIGRTFAGYSEDLPSVGFTGKEHVGPPGSGIDYQRKHNPWVNWQALSDDAIGTNQLPSTVNLPFTAFPKSEVEFPKLPMVSFVIPNQINDGHQSSAAPAGTNYGRTMDWWLKQHIEPYRRWAMTHNSLLIITWDEDEDDYKPVNDLDGTRVAKLYTNHIPTIMAGERVIPGTYTDRIDHYNVLRTIEDLYGISPLNTGDATATAIANIFKPLAGWQGVVASFRPK
jgi:hypothetical protein